MHERPPHTAAGLAHCGRPNFRWGASAARVQIVKSCARVCVLVLDRVVLTFLSTTAYQNRHTLRQCVLASLLYTLHYHFFFFFCILRVITTRMFGNISDLPIIYNFDHASAAPNSQGLHHLAGRQASQAISDCAALQFHTSTSTGAQPAAHVTPTPPVSARLQPTPASLSPCPAAYLRSTPRPR